MFSDACNTCSRLWVILWQAVTVYYLFRVLDKFTCHVWIKQLAIFSYSFVCCIDQNDCKWEPCACNLNLCCIDVIQWCDYFGGGYVFITDSSMIWLFVCYNVIWKIISILAKRELCVNLLEIYRLYFWDGLSWTRRIIDFESDPVKN